MIISPNSFADFKVFQKSQENHHSGEFSTHKDDNEEWE